MRIFPTIAHLRGYEPKIRQRYHEKNFAACIFAKMTSWTHSFLLKATNRKTDIVDSILFGQQQKN